MAKWSSKRKKYDVELIETEGEKTERQKIKLTKFLKREMVLTAITILVVTITIIGGSYAIFSNIAKAENYNVVKAGTLQIAYDDTSTGLGNIINLNGAYPESNEEGQKREPYKFKITNTGSLNAMYKVKILDDEGMIEEDGCREKLLDKTKIKYSINQKDPVILDSIKEEYIVVEGSLEAGKSITYEIRMWIDESAGNEVLGTHYHGKIVVEGVQDDREKAVDVLMTKTNQATLAYENATDEQKKEMFTFTHTAGEQQAGWSEEELTDYRYIGTTPNNYVTFNNETWRIIGIFTVEDENGKKEKRMKIIRNESIGDYSFDNKPSGTGSSDSEHGSSYWVDSRLKDVLNSGPYYNRTSGSCPYGQNNVTTDCDFSSNGLTDTAKSMIGKTKWYLGASASGIKVNEYYAGERGTAIGKSGRETSWVGEVGLMYPSDYGYAASESSCLNTGLNQYNTIWCQNRDWLFNSTEQWTIAPSSDSSSFVFRVYSNGNVSDPGAYNPIGSRPSIYIKSNVIITGGDGSEGNPYKLAL